ncbi:MAG: beta-galactosidase, partial [Calditrichaeota bacterium]
LGDHYGGFTVWERDITQHVNPGETARLCVLVIDRADEISYGSGYAKHPIGGILRNVSIMALPDNYPQQVSITTDFDEEYENAELVVQGKMRTASQLSRIELKLFDQAGQPVELATKSYPITNTDLFKVRNRINRPLKWNAEHPYLYSLQLSFWENEEQLWLRNFNVGFREIEIKGNQFLLNGIPVKLRGACRHDIHPLLGRVSTPDYELMDVLLAKEANINFIRTSHYPPTEHFLKLCDQYGLYVEDETAVCFVGSHRTSDYHPGASQDDSEFSNRYLSQLNEMVMNHRNHPSVIFWSIGNENSFGSNFKKSYDWVKMTDPTRPVIFSYPGNVPDSIQAYDIISMHYPGVSGTMEQYGVKTESFSHKIKPVIFDEWAHVPCYNPFTLKEDPNIRDFWGISLDSMWQKTYDADGALGGAIWGMIDEIFMLPGDLAGFNQWWGKMDAHIHPGEYAGHAIGYGEWGIIDVWRRKKPEFWNVKKAYSPVRLLQIEFKDIQTNAAIEIPVYNRHDFTNLNQVKLRYTINNRSRFLPAPDVPAHAKGTIHLPLDEWPNDGAVILEFLRPDNSMIDSYTIHLNRTDTPEPFVASSTGIELLEDESDYVITTTNDLKFMIEKHSGLFKMLEAKDSRLIFTGPHLNLRTLGKQLLYSSHIMNDYGRNWKLRNLEVLKQDGYAEISLAGDYELVRDVAFVIRIYGDGSITTTFSLDKTPPEVIREIGVIYSVEDRIDSLAWKRDSYWSDVPIGHLSAREGTTPLYAESLNRYRVPPDKEWPNDSKSFFYNGMEDEQSEALSYVAKATKENIREYDLYIDNISRLTVLGGGHESCRLHKQDGQILLFINTLIDYPDIAWGNYSRSIMLPDTYSATIMMRFR